MTLTLVDDAALERSHVVANARMNRARRLSGINSYERELGFDPLAWLRARPAQHGSAAWLDLCCGSGQALIEAASTCAATGEQITFRGVDLIDSFVEIPAALRSLRLEAASLHRWDSPDRFDLITCVHGLHYVGDKLGLVERAVSWLVPGGQFLAHLDLANLRRASGEPLGRLALARFRAAGMVFDRRSSLLTCSGPRSIAFGLKCLGADDSAGPNRTRQEAVDSYYVASGARRAVKNRWA
ncbi:MAG: class I SAM-dependent methyltransferase [Pirellulales bacterium]|nr:class I SAM-dependent methyltransferase [Pirellulales bacterium]